MSNYQPIPKETHLKRGYCCGHGCFHCPWRVPRPLQETPVNSFLVEALRNADWEATIYSAQQSLDTTPFVVQDRITIHYQPYRKEDDNIRNF